MSALERQIDTTQCPTCGATFGQNCLADKEKPAGFTVCDARPITYKTPRIKDIDLEDADVWHVFLHGRPVGTFERGAHTEHYPDTLSGPGFYEYPDYLFFTDAISAETIPLCPITEEEKS